MDAIETALSQASSMHRHRRLLTFGASAAVLAAQPMRRAWARTASPPRIGVLFFGNRQMETVRGAPVFDTAMAELGRRPGIDVIIESRHGTAPDLLPRLADMQGRPSISGFHSLMADAGFPMSYGADLLDLIRRSASYVDRILKGASPGEMAIERPTRFQLTMNRATMRALGVAPAQAVMSRVDKFVQ